MLYNKFSEEKSVFFSPLQNRYSLVAPLVPPWDGKRIILTLKSRGTLKPMFF